MEKNSLENILAAVCNIPSSFHSADLRNYFSQVIEEGAFTCFHYKHRPEIKKGELNGEHKDSCVCVISVSCEEAFNKIFNLYHQKNWINKSGEYFSTKCVILKLSAQLKKTPKDIYVTKQEKKYRNRHSPIEEFTFSDLMCLSELNPPQQVMPNGNVGTPIPIFQNLIRNCELPSSIIKKLGLVFPGNASKRRYGNVPFVYEDTNCVSLKTLDPLMATTGNGCIVNDCDDTSNIHGILQPNANHRYESSFEENKDVSDSGDDDDDDTCEEWERHEAFTNDVTSQERAKERLFEEEIELKWEKGGSGLVFYTDAQYWAEENGDFDEQNTDQWDIDTREFYGGKGDRDARDFVQICEEKRLRMGRPLVKSKRVKKGEWDNATKLQRSKAQIGKFETYTKGIGKKILKKFGWKENEGLGPSTSCGISEPIIADGQAPNNTKGFGYHGENILGDEQKKNVGKVYKQSTKISRSLMVQDQPVRSNTVEPLASHSYLFPQFQSNLVALYSKHKPFCKTTRHTMVPGNDGIIITTKYDDPLEIDEESEILRSQHPSALKHIPLTPKGPLAGKINYPTSKLVNQPHTDVRQSQRPFVGCSEEVKRIRLYTPYVQFVRPSSSTEWFLSPKETVFKTDHLNITN